MYCKLSPSCSISGGGGFGFSCFEPKASIHTTMRNRKPVSPAAKIGSLTWYSKIKIGKHLPTDFRILSHLTSSINVRNSPRVTRDLLRTSWCSPVSNNKFAGVNHVQTSITISVCLKSFLASFFLLSSSIWILRAGQTDANEQTGVIHTRVLGSQCLLSYARLTHLPLF